MQLQCRPSGVGTKALSHPRRAARLCAHSLCAGLLFAFANSNCWAQQQIIKVSQSAWIALIPPEQDMIQRKFIVDVANTGSFGTVIDNQGMNESTPGTTGGANLGGAVANAAYVDNAVRTGNYSAKGQLAAGILGALVGSTLDSKARAQFHFRYAVKLGNGNIQYFDELRTDTFRHPVGVCVSVPVVALVDQQLCTQTADTLRAAYLQMPTARASPPPPPPRDTSGNAGTLKEANSAGANVLVSCSLGSLAPVQTSAEKCAAINGRQVQ